MVECKSVLSYKYSVLHNNAKRITTYFYTQPANKINRRVRESKRHSQIVVYYAPNNRRKRAMLFKGVFNNNIHVICL